MHFQELLKGIDSLYLSFWGTLKPGLLEVLEIKKQKAQSEDMEDNVEAILNIGEHHFEIRDKGQGYFSYVIADNWFFIKISASTKKMVPTVYAQISSELLNCSGLDLAVSNLREVLNNLMESITKEQVSRADIFVDSHSDFDFGSVPRESWITRVDKIDQYWSGNRFNGWVIGRGGDISARLYDKSIEIGISKKDFFKSLWFERGWQDGQRVFRLEYQLRRLFLKQLSIDTVLDLQNTMNDIWKIATCEWLRLGVDDGDENRSRWKTAPVWLNLQQVRFGDGSYADVKREVSKCRFPHRETILINGLGYLISYAAMNGFSNLSQAAQGFLADAGTYLDVRATESANSKFVDSLDYVNKKIKLKKRKFNKLYDEVPF